jgi:hypothetical protein
VTDSQQSSGSAHGGKASSKTRPAEVAPATGNPPNAPVTDTDTTVPAPGWTADPTPKYETPQSELPPQNKTVSTSAQSDNLDEYVPGSAQGGPAPTKPNLTPRRGR